MKKLFVCLAVLVGLVYCYSNNSNFSLQNYFSGVYYCYTESEIDSTSLNLGFCYMSNSYSSNLIGESMIVENLEPIAAITSLNAKIIKTEQINNASIIYAYSSAINSYVTIDGKKVNLQLACYDDYCVIGWPLILGSY